MPFWNREKLKNDYLVRALIVYALLLKLFYLGLPEIMHEEGYYWNYAQHLDLGYLDHPPMVGWVIWICTHLLGDSALNGRHDVIRYGRIP